MIDNKLLEIYLIILIILVVIYLFFFSLIKYLFSLNNTKINESITNEGYIQQMD